MLLSRTSPQLHLIPEKFKEEFFTEVINTYEDIHNYDNNMVVVDDIAIEENVLWFLNRVAEVDVFEDEYQHQYTDPIKSMEYFITDIGAVLKIKRMFFYSDHISDYMNYPCKEVW